MQRTARTTLGAAFVLSIVLHLTLLPLVHAPAEPQPDEQIPFNIETARPIPTPHPTPHPTPSPTPRPTPQPTVPPHHAAHPPPQHRSVNVAHQSSRPHGSAPQAAASNSPATNPGADTGSASEPSSAAPALPTPAASPAPTDAPTHPPACAQPNVAAATIEPALPDTPPIAAQQGISGNVTVLVTLDEQSRVVDARVVSSPSALLDEAAVRAARASRFRTEVRDCRPVAADYAFIVEFSGQ